MLLQSPSPSKNIAFRKGKVDHGPWRKCRFERYHSAKSPLTLLNSFQPHDAKLTTVIILIAAIFTPQDQSSFTSHRTQLFDGWAIVKRDIVPQDLIESIQLDPMTSDRRTKIELNQQTMVVKQTLSTHNGRKLQRYLRNQANRSSHFSNSPFLSPVFTHQKKHQGAKQYQHC